MGPNSLEFLTAMKYQLWNGRECSIDLPSKGPESIDCKSSAQQPPSELLLQTVNTRLSITTCTRLLTQYMVQYRIGGI